MLLSSASNRQRWCGIFVGSTRILRVLCGAACIQWLEVLWCIRNRQSSLLESSVGCLLYVLPAFPPVSLQEYTIKSISARLRIQLRPTTRGLRTRPLLHGLRVMLELRLERPTVSQQKPDICSQTWCFCEVSRNRSPVVSKPALAPTTVHRNRNGSSVCGLASGTTAA